MNRLITLFFLIASFSLEANSTIEVRGAAFIPSKKLFREVYGEVLPSYQIEASTELGCCFYLFANLDDVYQTGRVHDCGKTEINMLNFSMGPKYVCCVKPWLDLYVGIAPVVTWTFVRNHCFGEIRTEYNTSGGGIVKLGANIYVYQNLFLDLFADYQCQNAFKRNVYVGGIKTGLGVGYSF